MTEEKSFRLRLPEGAAIGSVVAEFRMTRASQANEMARRTRVLGALVSLEEKPRNQLAKAVAEGCRVFHSLDMATIVRFAIGEWHHQTLLEVVISPADDGDFPTSFPPDESLLGKLNQNASSLAKFEWKENPGGSPTLILAQTAPSLVRVTPEEVAHWAELLNANTPEEAIALADGKRQQSESELGIARSRGTLPESNQQPANDREDVETLSLVVRRATNAILILDAGGVIQWANEAFASLTGYAVAEAIGQPLDDLVWGPSTSPDAIREFHQAFRNGHELTQDVMQYRRDGHTFWVECKLIPVHDDQGRISRWIIIQSDVTRRHQTEEALRAAKQAAESSSRSKSEFLANMSHEIRTPLNAILGMTELALTTHLTDEQREYLRTVQSSADTLLQLLNDVLDISKIEAGKMQIEEIDFNLAEIVRETLKALAVKAHEKGLELAVHMPMDIPQFLRGDPTRIRQVLFNLVGNAIKFTEYGEVVVDIEEQWRTGEDVCLHFSVRDTGIGIRKDRLQKIFESFTQVDSSMARRFGGTGLGLTITSRLVRMMKGKIWVQSQENDGSTFHFTLQLKLGQEMAKGRPLVDASQLEGKQALIVDDNATNRRILAELLTHWNISSIMSEGAAAALKELEEASRRDQPFDLVLLDAMMPVVDGFQLAEIIKQRPDLKCGTVMMLSSADRPNSAARCRQLGIETFLVKPVSASALLEAILAALSGTVTEPSEEHRLEPDPDIIAVPEPQKKLRVLVADDHEPNRNLAMRILQRRGHECIPASDGEEAIAAHAQSQFDAVLMDVQMPGCDGYSATQAIRKREKAAGSHVPIIALTAHALAGDREKCLAAGMDAYLAKPLHARELVALVERVTGVQEAPDTERPSSASSPRTAAFDISAALDRMNGEMDLLKEHIGYVLNDVPELIERMRTAITNRDNRLLEISAHRLKSLVSSYNHTEARELAQNLERMGEENQLENAEAAIDDLQLLIRQFTEALQQYLDQQA